MYVILVMALDRSERNVLRDRWRGIKHDILACVSSGGATLRFFTLEKLKTWIEDMDEMPVNEVDADEASDIYQKWRGEERVRQKHRRRRYARTNRQRASSWYSFASVDLPYSPWSWSCALARDRPSDLSLRVSSYPEIQWASQKAKKYLA
ncbi:hypothetical protein KQX54_018435 [Cotesia glomerata]|uniref:Uncharacterized protein n=1 Tax=Cotesia glomerata TaxID=32391 RepID=A0AAV7IF32_COTGL|nr:hypothetical protein KQX54_018435 [Cotesia glomerata]